MQQALVAEKAALCKIGEQIRAWKCVWHQIILRANFHPHDSFLVTVTWQFFPQACAFTFIVSASCRYFITCWGPAVPFGVCLSLQQRWCFCWYNLQQFRGLYLVKELTTMEKVSKNFAQEQMEDCSGFVFSKDLWHFLWVLCYFGVFCTIVTFLIYLKDRL